MKLMRKYTILLTICLLTFFFNIEDAFAVKGLKRDTLPIAQLGVKHKPDNSNQTQAVKSPKKHKKRINWDKKLDLTETQKIQVQDIYKASQPVVDMLYQQIVDAHKKIAEIYQEDDMKIRNILDSKQRIKFDKEQIQMQKQRGEKVSGPKPSRKRMPQM